MDTYTVLHGDSLNSIAAKKGTTALALYSTNAAIIGEFTTRPQPGLVLTLPAATEEGTATPDAQTPPTPPWPTGGGSLTADQQAAMDAARNVPLSAANPVASMADVPGENGLSLPVDVLTTSDEDQSKVLSPDGMGGIQVHAAGPFLTVVHAAPTTWANYFMFDDTASTGGLYAWSGSAYVKIGLATS
jgi:hypothetical protein